MRLAHIALALLATLTACSPAAAPAGGEENPFLVTETSTPEASFTPVPTRRTFAPGELMEYIAQTGDTLPALVSRFNTSEAEIRAANPVIPEQVTTLPPGFPMQIPIYYKALWGSSYQIIPDSLYVNGPAQVGFEVQGFLNQHNGWLKTHVEQITDGPRTGAEIIELVATNFSISPRLLLALVEFHAGGVTNPTPPVSRYVLGYQNQGYPGLYLQLVWAANTLNNGYYTHRRGGLLEFEHPDGRLERPDPWQNAASIGLHYYFSRNYSSPEYDQMVGPAGLAQTYASLFGDPWTTEPHLPGSLQQPSLKLPFEKGKTWNYTGGPHAGWGRGEPFAAVDFAPSGVSSCNTTEEWVTAMADGLVVRSEPGTVVLDLDMDGLEQTGWIIFYLHLSNENRAQAGQMVLRGDKIGHPSCEGGESTGTHVHVARKYNGEWILADGPLAFNMEGWVVQNGRQAYDGSMSRFSQIILSSLVSEAKSQIRSEE